MELTLKPVAITAMLVLLWSLEGLWPMFGARGRRSSHYATNVGLGVLNAIIAAALLGGALLFVTEWARGAEFGLIRWLNLPAWAGFAVAIVVFDAWQYTWHYLSHKVPLLWRFHAVHHSDAELDASSGVRFHTGEIVLSTVARLAVTPLLGMTMAHLLVYELIMLPIVLFHHSNVRMPERVDRVLRLVIVTPRMHWVHHSDWRPETDSNFASIFSFWDRLFGTFRLRRDPATLHLGLVGYREAQWRRLGGALAAPFRPMPQGEGHPPEDYDASASSPKTSAEKR